MEGVDPDLMSVDELIGSSQWPNLGATDPTLDPAYNPYSDPGPGYDEMYPTSQQALAGSAGVRGMASGGMAGATGPEVAVLGEEGPELVLNAKQTQELAQALGGSQAIGGTPTDSTPIGGTPLGDLNQYKHGGVAGSHKKVKGYAAGGVAGAGQQPDQEMSYEELMEYMTTLNEQFKGAL